MGSFLRYSFPGRLPNWNFGSVPWNESSDVAAVHEQHKKTRENAERNEHGIFRKDRGHRRNGNWRPPWRTPTQFSLSAATTAKTAKALKNTRQSSISATASRRCHGLSALEAEVDGEAVPDHAGRARNGKPGRPAEPRAEEHRDDALEKIAQQREQRLREGRASELHWPRPRCRFRACARPDGRCIWRSEWKRSESR